MSGLIVAGSLVVALVTIAVNLRGLAIHRRLRAALCEERRKRRETESALAIAEAQLAATEVRLARCAKGCQDTLARAAVASWRRPVIRAN